MPHVLKEKDPQQLIKKLHFTPEPENDSKKSCAKDKYIPPFCFSNNGFRVFGQPKSSAEDSCSICSSEVFKQNAKSCKKGKNDKNLSSLVGIPEKNHAPQF